MLSNTFVQLMCTEVTATAIQKGWWNGATADDIPKKIVFRKANRHVDEALWLVVSELCEAYEIYRMPDFDPHKVWETPTGKPEGFSIEVADAAIRTFDLVGALGAKIYESPEPYPDFNERVNLATVKLRVTKGIINLSSEISNALATPTDAYYRYSVKHIITPTLESILQGFVTIADLYKFDLEGAMQRKHAYNKTRPFRHGNKNA